MPRRGDRKTRPPAESLPEHAPTKRVLLLILGGGVLAAACLVAAVWPSAPALPLATPVAVRPEPAPEVQPVPQVEAAPPLSPSMAKWKRCLALYREEDYEGCLAVCDAMIANEPQRYVLILRRFEPVIGCGNCVEDDQEPIFPHSRRLLCYEKLGRWRQRVDAVETVRTRPDQLFGWSDLKALERLRDVEGGSPALHDRIAAVSEAYHQELVKRDVRHSRCRVLDVPPPWAYSELRLLDAMNWVWSSSGPAHSREIAEKALVDLRRKPRSVRTRVALAEANRLAGRPDVAALIAGRVLQEAGALPPTRSDARQVWCSAVRVVLASFDDAARADQDVRSGQETWRRAYGWLVEREVALRRAGLPGRLAQWKVVALREAGERFEAARVLRMARAELTDDPKRLAQLESGVARSRFPGRAAGRRVR